jgi:hypothetical protein
MKAKCLFFFMICLLCSGMTFAQRTIDDIKDDSLRQFLQRGLSASVQYLRDRGLDTGSGGILRFEPCRSMVFTTREKRQLCYIKEGELTTPMIANIIFTFRYRRMPDTLEIDIDLIYFPGGREVSYKQHKDVVAAKLVGELEKERIPFGLASLRNFIKKRKLKEPHIGIEIIAIQEPDLLKTFNWMVMKDGHYLLQRLNPKTGKSQASVPERFQPPKMKSR